MNQRSNCQHLSGHRKSKRVPEKHLFLLYWLHQSLRLCGSQQTVENSEKDGSTRQPDLPLEKFICRSGRTVRTGHETTYWFQIGKGVRQGCILSPCLFNLYAEYINNFRYADDTTFMAESEDKLKSLLMKVKVECEKVGLKLSIQKTKIMDLVPSLHGK